MKKMLALVLVAVMGACCLAVSAAADEVIVAVSDFVDLFNFYAALTGSSFSLTGDNMDVMSLGKKATLIKTIFNGCEILSLTTDTSLRNIAEVTCSYAVGAPGSAGRASEFVEMVFLAMLGCGISSDDIASAMDTFSKNGIGSTVYIGGFVIDYEEAVTGNISFHIVRK